MKKTRLEKLLDVVFPRWLQRLSLVIGVVLIALEIICPDFMAGWKTVLLWVVIPYTVISFWLSGYFVGLIHSEKQKRGNKETPNE